MKYYYETKSNGKCGCSNYMWHVTEKYKTKAELKKKNSFRKITEILTEDQLKAGYPTYFEKIMNEAKPY